MRFHKVFDHIVEHIQQRNEAINNDLIFSNLSFFQVRPLLMTSTNYPIDLKLPKWWDVMGLKIDKIMGYNGLATKKLIIHKLLEVFCLSTLKYFDFFWEGKTTNIRLKNCLIVSSFQLYKSVKLFLKSILNNKFFGSLLSINAQIF